MSSLPQPSVALTGACSVLFNDTLYAYSPDAFQSLALSTGAEWEDLPSGESVTGGVCVGSTPADLSQAGLFVVGGTSSNSSYSGLQKYTYTTGQWESIVLESIVTQDRLYHSATYLNDSNLIVMYAGSQDGSTGQSTQTFTIEAASPYSVLSYQSVAPPAKQPYLLPWSSSQAVVLGGSDTNTAVYLFTPGSGWADSGTTLAAAITKNVSEVQATIVTGDDTSKNLYLFDMSVSPNEVSRMVLRNAVGGSIAASAAVRRSVDLVPRADSLTLDTWPAYNSSLASTTTRSGYCLAADASGVVVAAGGTSSDEVLCMFNGRTNAWENTTTIFGSRKFTIESSEDPSSSASASATATSTTSTSAAATSATSAATSAASSSATAAAGISVASNYSSSGTSSGAIIGAVVGSVAGAIMILIIAFMLLVRRRKQAPPPGSHAHGASSGGPSEKGSQVLPKSHAARAIGGQKATYRAGHQAQDSEGSFSSVAILMNKVNQPRTPQLVRPGNFGDLKDTSAGTYNKTLKSTISKPIPQATSNPGLAMPQSAKLEEANLGPSAYGRNLTPGHANAGQVDAQGNTRRSSGWNRYWSGGSALNILGFGSGNNRRSTNRQTMASDMSSRYSTADTTQQQMHRITQDSATVPPLDIPMMPDARPRFQRVNSGSPTVSGFNNAFDNGLQGKIERSASTKSSQSGYSSGVPASVHEAWDPTEFDDKPWGADRAPSSAYSGTVVSGAGYNTGLAPASAAAGGQRAHVPSGLSQQPQLAVASTSSDMSWLNLGGGSRV